MLTLPSSSRSDTDSRYRFFRETSFCVDFSRWRVVARHDVGVKHVGQSHWMCLEFDVIPLPEAIIDVGKLLVQGLGKASVSSKKIRCCVLDMLGQRGG